MFIRKAWALEVTCKFLRNHFSKIILRFLTQKTRQILLQSLDTSTPSPCFSVLIIRGANLHNYL